MSGDDVPLYHAPPKAPPPLPKSALDGMTKKQLQVHAGLMGIKREGEGWAKCCPPDGDKSDIIRAIVRMQSGASGSGGGLPGASSSGGLPGASSSGGPPGDDDKGSGGDDDKGSGEDDDKAESSNSHDDNQEEAMQIFVKMPCSKIITIDAETDWTVGMVKVAVQTKEGIPFKQQRLIFHDKQLENERQLADYNIEKDCCLQCLLGIQGGARVIKSIVKSKALDKIREVDRPMFQQALDTGILVNNATAFSLRGEINAMNLQDLASLKEYLTNKNKKTSNMVLLKGIYEQIASYKNMANTMCKLAASMEHLKQLIHDDIDGNWIDDSGVAKMDSMKELVSNRLAVKEAEASTAAAAAPMDEL